MGRGELAARGKNRGGRIPRQMPSACSPRSSPYMRCGSGGRPSLDPTSLLARSPIRVHRTGISGRAATATRKSCAAAHTPLLSESHKCHCALPRPSCKCNWTPRVWRRCRQAQTHAVCALSHLLYRGEVVFSGVGQTLH